MRDELKEIECDEHGPSYATIMCCHLVTGSDLGFYAYRVPIEHLFIVLILTEIRWPEIP